MRDLFVISDYVKALSGARRLPPESAAPPAETTLDERTPLPWRTLLLQGSAFWLATRIAYALVTYFAVIFNAQTPGSAWTLIQFSPQMLLTAWGQWDTGWYISIAQHWYSVANPLATAFFPLYPLLIRLTIGMIGAANSLLAGMLISNLAALVTFVGLLALAWQEEGAARAPFALKAFAVYPFAFFTAAAYAESPFLAVVVFCLLFARRGQWWGAALCGFLAALTRPTAIILILPVAWEFARQHVYLFRAGWPRSLREHLPELAGGVAAIGAVPFAVGLYALYIHSIFGSFTTFISEERLGWGHRSITHLSLDVEMARSMAQVVPWSNEQARMLVDIAPLVIIVALTLLFWRRMPFSFVLYMAGALFVSISSPISFILFDPFVSVGRYLLMSIPIFLLVSRPMQRHPAFDQLIVMTGLMLQAVLLGFFLRGGWII